MGSVPMAASLPLARLAGVGGVVFFANAALLILQLVASRLLAPFIGSDLYTWTSIIGVFLAGITLGNAFGGKLADRYPSPRTLVAVLLLGAACAAWMAIAPPLFHSFYRSIPLAPRIPLLCAILCLPAGFVLSLLTPLSIKLGLPDVGRTGRVAGLVFALSTLGCLLGNYVTGFYLVPAFTVNSLVYFAVGTLLVLAAATFFVLQEPPPTLEIVPSSEKVPEETPAEVPANPHTFGSIREAFAVVFLASFCGMTLELAASRVIAEKLGVSLFTWTGVIGVMLAGTAIGNLLGGIIADRVNRDGSSANPRVALACTFIGAGVATITVIPELSFFTHLPLVEKSLTGQVLGWSFVLFFLPMLALGMISPQVIRLAVPDVAQAGRVAGRVYAWSTAGAIVGTFAAGYILISVLTVKGTLIAATAVLTLTGCQVGPVWKNNLLLYAASIALGGTTGGAILVAMTTYDQSVVVSRESNYYHIKVTRGWDTRPDKSTFEVLDLHLDHLLHSSVDVEDPLYIHYKHEHVQMEFLRAARSEAAVPKCLVIGGGGYTFPRYAKTVFPEMELDVVEIDPAVTKVAYEYLGLSKELGIRDFNMDGRQFVAERATPGSYDLVVQDAVNDLSVPSHLVTKEYNDAVKRALKPDGVYLLTIIDEIEAGKLWRACAATLGQTFKHVELIATVDDLDYLTVSRHVYVIYASDKPLEVMKLREKAFATPGRHPEFAFYVNVLPAEYLTPFLMEEPGVILTDQFAPVDNLMADVFRRR
jgi:spermidine synthase/MFS family permease